MNHSDKQYWFPARKVGWGWGIANNWQGAVVQLGIPAGLVAAGWYLLPRKEVGLFMAIFAVALFAFLVLHWIKGEPPSWRW